MPEYLHPVIAMMPDPSGQFMRRQSFAAGPRRTDTPETERVPLLCQYSHGSYIITFYDGKFRHPTNGSSWAAPLQWAYITWDDVPMDEPQPGPVAVESRAEWLYDTMKIIAKFWKFRDVQDVADKIAWPNDREGAPE